MHDICGGDAVGVDDGGGLTMMLCVLMCVAGCGGRSILEQRVIVMALRIARTKMIVLMPVEKVEAMVEVANKRRAAKSQCMNCTICASVILDPMRYKIFECTSKKCKLVFPEVKCRWRCKMTTCSQSSLA